MMGNISEKAVIGKGTYLAPGVVVEDGVVIGENCYIDYNTIIKKNVTIGDNTFVGANCILGEFLYDFFADRTNKEHPLEIGKNCLIRSGSIFYGDSTIGDDVQTGHRVTIREKAHIGAHTSIGTLCDIQGDCTIGEYVHLHSNVHVGMKTTIHNYVWVFPYCIFTNDPTPPSETLKGVTVEEFAIVCTGTVVLPGVHIGKDALVGAGCTLTKDAPEARIIVGNPGRDVGAVTKIKDEEGNDVYPWRYSFKRGTPWAQSDYDTWIAQNASREE